MANLYTSSDSKLSTEMIYDTTKSKSQNAVNDALDKMVVVSDTAPTSSDNRLWVKQTNESGVQLATYAELQGVSNTVESLRAAVGSPLKAETVAGMTDNSKVYVYVGSESGYTSGHWYYYDGSAWTDGGIYNSAAVQTDSTLSIENVPADAKACGELKTAMYDLDTDYTAIASATGGTSKTWYDVPLYAGLHYLVQNLGSTGFSIKVADNHGVGIETLADVSASSDVIVTPSHDGVLAISTINQSISYAVYKRGIKYNVDANKNNIIANASPYNTIILESGSYLHSSLTTGIVAKVPDVARIRNKYPVALKDIRSITYPDGYEGVIYYFDSAYNYISHTGWQTAITYQAFNNSAAYGMMLIRNKTNTSADISGNVATVQSGLIVESLFSAFTKTENQANALERVNYIDLFRDFPPTYTNSTTGEVQFIWSADRSYCSVFGTATSNKADNIYYDKNALPNGIAAGQEYDVSFTTTDSKISLFVVFYNGNTELYGEQYYESSYMFVPANCTGLLLRIQVNGNAQGVTVNGRISDITVRDSDIPANAPFIITFKDDDAMADAYVTKYHDNCMHNGIRGCYSVLTDKIESGATSVQKLLDYEDDGFTMLTHGYSQGSDSPWSGGTVDEKRADMAKGLRDMRTYNFVNYNYWQTPGGVNDADNFEVSLSLGLKCTVSSVSVNGINRYGNATKYRLDTYSLAENDTNPNNSLATAKARIDQLIARGRGGWLIITTHFYNWDGLSYDTTEDENGYAVGYARFNEIVQYAIASGAQVLSFADAWAKFEPFMVDKTAT